MQLAFASLQKETKMKNIIENTLTSVDSTRGTSLQRTEITSADSLFSATYELARMKAALSSASLASRPPNPSVPVASLPIYSNLSQNARISNAAASLTGTEPSLHERALALRAYRQEILASNIANADTPNYKAVDIDIKEALNNHTPLSEIPIKYQNNKSPGIDGNTVDMDMERQKFAQNAIMYEFAVDKVKGKYKSISDLLQNLPY